MKHRANDPEQEYRQTAEEILNKFKNGEKLLMKSAMFNNILQMLIRGVSVYDVIEMILQNLEDSTNAMKLYIEHDTRPIEINGQIFEFKDPKDIKP